MFTNVFGKFQKLGKALMTPIAVLPIAAILLRLGAGVPGIEGMFADIILKAGAGVFDNLAILFAIGIAFGLAKGNHGAAALAGAVGYYVTTNVYTVINPDVNAGVFVGIVVGIMAGMLYNKFHDIQLPEFLGFFGGKRFVPIITSVASIFLGLVFGYVWPFIQNGLDTFGNLIVNSGAIGQFLYGFLNRLLIPTGLHHVLNTIFWFTHGEFTNAAGEVIRGDLFRFLAGDPTAGVFMTGFFPVMMFGLPAAALAMYTTAKKEYKTSVGGALFSVALTAFLTGITEPIEFMFLFLAPGLYFIHAVLTGVALVITNMLGILHGFGFSAGLFDYIINFNLASKPVLLIFVGLGFGVVYYLIFVFAIRKFDLSTPGRVDESGEGVADLIEEKGLSGLAAEYLLAIGGKGNVVEVDACITRLRLTLKDSSVVSEDMVKTLGASGVIRPNNKNVQIVVGTKAEIIADEMKRLL
ncbi:PTS sugar transporter [Petrocella atlantisensis]|uniref:PTS sugar transporter n=1 Tax=Petrocella atlantisensis TaxID=2173034 RepID=A0A3P7PBU0_9FIRM|nr:N-acetylglucosamine-specific PTS transporter subunit IIBC [Petrocella atlantisensis]VDN47623.1 PTS sugar transporter [Petrocella atlantisensis]